ncbi:MAG TPA: ATP-binding cassette domain-containing protein [Azonexus sp.]|nr:ATP-binding cassette domain-containing protein [Azonexus sp.]
MASLLQITDITLTLNHSKVLHDLDFAVAEGEIHALLGTNGSGKSSLALMVMGCQHYAPETGSVCFESHDIKDWPIHRRARAGISLAWQEPTRFEGLSVQDYLHLDSGWRAPEACLEAVGLDPAVYLHRMVDKSLSGGERKRIELASMLAMQPKLAMLDEPTAGVDVLSLEEVTEAIRHLRQGGSSVLLITHQEDLAACADRASQLCGGRVVFSGSPVDVAQHYRGRNCIRCDGNCANDA